MTKNIFLILLTALSLVALQQLFSDDARVKATVYSVCHYSNQITSGPAEEACGKAQDASNTEFLCSTNTTNANCWVEQK